MPLQGLAAMPSRVADRHRLQCVMRDLVPLCTDKVSCLELCSQRRLNAERLPLGSAAGTPARADRILLRCAMTGGLLAGKRVLITGAGAAHTSVERAVMASTGLAESPTACRAWHWQGECSSYPLWTKRVA